MLLLLLLLLVSPVGMIHLRVFSMCLACVVCVHYPTLHQVASALPSTPAAKKRSLATASAATTSPPPPPTKKSRGATTTASTPMMPPASAHCTSVSRVTQASVTVSQAAAAGGTGQVDPACPLPSPRQVAGDHDVMLNQVDISANKNKFYLAQVSLRPDSGGGGWCAADSGMVAVA